MSPRRVWGKAANEASIRVRRAKSLERAREARALIDKGSTIVAAAKRLDCDAAALGRALKRLAAVDQKGTS